VGCALPHTKHELVELLDGAGLRPRHRWGQNFLIDLNLMRLLVEAAEIQPDDVVLEVGCGTGSMTGLLAERAGAVVTVDIDEGLAQVAENELEQCENVTVLCCDVLANKSTIAPMVVEAISQARERLGGRVLLVANLPYQVAGPLMIDLLLQAVPVAGMFVTVQAEVADRMVSGPAVKAYGPLSIILQATGAVKRLRTLSPGAFWPRPRVTSAMVAWRRDGESCEAIDNMHRLKAVIDLLLGRRRKKISTCLAKSELGDELLGVIERLGIDPDARGETLSPLQFVALANAPAAD
jgi:16S rRNA (adenine1518-N6/adenine1519-N6)-dimethyltransferase